MNLDAYIDNLLSPIADKISGIIFASITVRGVEVQFLVALLIFAALFFYYKIAFYWDLGF